MQQAAAMPLGPEGAGLSLDPEAQKPFQLVKYYSVTSLAIILLFTLLISTVLTRRAGDLLLHKREQYALLLAENLNHQVMTRFVIPALRDYGGINVGQPAQFKLLDAVVRNTIHSFQVRQVNIMDLQGNIIYSTQPVYIARTGDEGPHFQTALAGGHASVVSPPWNLLDFGGGPPRVLKTFIPLRDERFRTAEMGPPRAVFEITLDLSDDFREVWVNQLIIIGTLLTMMALLFVILRSIVLRGQRIMAQRTALEVKLKEQLSQAERLAALGRMVSGVAHEIRNPLGIVRSTAELLGSRVDADNRALAEIIVDESSRLGRIVTEFLDFARPQKPRLEPLVVEEVLERNLHVLAPEAQRVGVEVRRRFARQRRPIRGDRDLLYRAFLNILNNALQVLEQQGGVITVSTRQVNREDGRWVVVAVDDSGPGFDQEIRGRIFDPFFTTREQGTGLGLSIVSNIVASHQGRVEVGDAPGGGGRVEVWLKAVEAD